MPTAAQILAAEQRRTEVATRYLQGEYQATIAKALGVSQQRISQDLESIRRHWLAASVRDFDAARAQELAKIDHAEQEYWAAWQRSIQPREVTLTEQTYGEKPSRKASVRREGQAGDPRFLDGVLRCIERRCAILGLNAPTTCMLEWDTLSVAQLERLARGERPREVLLAEA